MGLLDQSAPQQQQPQEGTQDPSGQQLNQSQEQQMYEKLASMALNYVYSDAGADMVAEGLRLENADIIQNAGNVVSKIIMRLIISVRTAGQSIPPKMMIQAGMEISAAVLELAEEDGELPNAEPGMLDAVFYAAITIVGRELPDDMLSAQERQEVGRTLEEIQQMQGGEQQPNPSQQQAPQQQANPQQEMPR